MASGAAADGGSLNFDSIPLLDLRLLSQSELYSLSVCSSTAFDLRRCDDVVIPKIDRSVFNESAGSRKQTYSRLRLAPPSSSSSAPRRRTPLVRPSFTKIQNNNSDPENAETSNIVGVLKDLFAVGFNPSELASSKTDCTDSLSPHKISTPTPSNPSKAHPTGMKRKRGQPIRDQLSGNGEGLTAAVSVDVVSDKGKVDGPLQVEIPGDGGGLSVEVNVEIVSEKVKVDEPSSVNEIVVGEFMEDKDRGVLNKDGLVVDLVALGTVGHPYEEEIRRRTEGLGTEEELLRYLSELKGEWSSRRQKKRIVDADEFGAAFPLGWKLSLAVKKKNGQVWLYCRRYISPGGLHFVTCKGVSSYLLSLQGVYDPNLPNSSVQLQPNVIVNDANKLTSVTVTESAVKDDIQKENPISHISSSSAFESTSGNCETQIITNAVELPEDGAGEKFSCNKCNKTVSDKEKLLQHQSSCGNKKHRRSRNVPRPTDGVIIRDGIYECQFCHKTFTERHRYTGHIGSHVRRQIKIEGASQAGDVGGGSVHPSSYGELTSRGNVQGSDDVGEINKGITNNGENSVSGNEDCKGVGGPKEANENRREADETMDIIAEANFCAEANVLVSGNNKSSNEDAGPGDRAAEMIDTSSSLQGGRSGNCSPLPLDDGTTHGLKGVDDASSSLQGGRSENCTSLPVDDGALHGLKGVVVTESSGTQIHEQSKASESSLLELNKCVEECDIDINTESTSQTRNREDFSVNGSIFDFFGTHDDRDKDLAVGANQQNSFDDLPCYNTGITENTSNSGSMISKPSRVSNISMQPTFQVEKASTKEDNSRLMMDKYRIDEPCGFGTYGKGSYEAARGGVSRDVEIQFGIRSASPSYNGLETSRKNDTGMSTFPLKEHMNSCKSSLVASSGQESMRGSENNEDEVRGGKVEAFEFDYFQNFGNGESSNPFSNAYAPLDSNLITGNEQHRKLGIFSDLTSASDRQFFVEDSLTRISGNPLVDHKQDLSNRLLTRSSIPQVSAEAKTFNNPTHPAKLTPVVNTRKHELSLSFGNLQDDLRTDSGGVQQGMGRMNNFNIHSVAQRTFGDQTHSSTLNNNLPCNMKQGRHFGTGNTDSPFNMRTTYDFGNNFNAAHTGYKMKTPAPNFMVGFGNNGSQSGNCGTAGDSWRTTRDNMFQNCFDAAPNMQVPSSNYFSTFSPAPNKAEGGLFGVKPNYTTHTDMTRPGRSEPVEYSFMGEESSNSESKMFSYTGNMGQGLDPSAYWMGKDVVMPNAGQSHQVASMCVWCRNVFLQDADQLGTQTGAIGSMCPSCSSRIPGQFNVL